MHLRDDRLTWVDALATPVAVLDTTGVLRAASRAFRARIPCDVGEVLGGDEGRHDLLRFLNIAARSRTPLPGRVQTDGCSAYRLVLPGLTEAAIVVHLDEPSSAFDVLNERLIAYEDADAGRWRATHELSIVRETLAAVVEHTPAAISLRDANGRYTLANAAFLKLIGRAEEEVVGKTDADVLPADVAATYAELDRLADEHGASPPTTEAFVVDGDRRDFLTHAFTVRAQQRDAYAHCRVSVDVTAPLAAERARREMEATLLHAQKLKSLGVLAGGIAHDFNNLLLGVMSNASVASESLVRDPAEARDCLTDIESASQQAAELCRQLLGYAGKGRFVVEPVDVSFVAGEIVQLLSVSLSKTTTFEMDLARDLPLCRADIAQLQQVVMNLVTNASEALAGEPGRVSLRTGVRRLTAEALEERYPSFDLRAGEFVFVEVSDTGSGMEPTVRDQIFEPFFTTKLEGRGLGLAAVLGIVRGHGGGLHVDTRVGVGTTFTLLMPTTDLTSMREKTAPPLRRAAGGCVLIVDDEKLVRNVARRILRRAGFTVEEAEDGLLGLQAYKANPRAYCAVLLDMTMPHLNGEQTFRAIRAIDPDARIVVSSGYNEQEATSLIVTESNALFLQKPYRPDMLVTAITSVARDE